MPLSELKERSARLVHKLTRMTKSRNAWKNKAVERAEDNRENRKTLSRRDQKIADLEQEIEALKKNLQQKAPT